MVASIQPLAGQSSQFSIPSAPQKTAVQAAYNAALMAKAAAPQAKSRSTPARPNSLPSNPPVNPVAFVSAMRMAAGGMTQWSAVSADFNNDGKPDLAAPIQTSKTPATYGISLALNNGNGTFQTALVLSNPNGANGDQILTGDFNKDGNQDLLVVHATSPATYEVWLGHGDGTFNTQSGATHQISTTFVAGGAIWDVNADGNPDLVFVDVQTPNAGVYTLLGNGDGTFQSPYVGYRLQPV